MDRSSNLSFAVAVFLSLMMVSAKVEFELGRNCMKLMGDALYSSDGTVMFTGKFRSPSSSVAGKIEYCDPIEFMRNGIIDSFSTLFSFSLINSTGGGLAFVLSSDGRKVGDGGAYMSIMKSNDSATGIFFSVEIDAAMDTEFSDINGNHVGLNLGIMASTVARDLGSIGIYLSNGSSPIFTWIDYDGPNRIFNVFVGQTQLKPKEAIIYGVVDLGIYFADSDAVFVGISGSTQGASAIHTIYSWKFRSYPELNPLNRDTLFFKIFYGIVGLILLLGGGFAIRCVGSKFKISCLNGGVFACCSNVNTCDQDESQIQLSANP